MPTERASLISAYREASYAPLRVHIVPQMQGLRRARKRSLLGANEHSEPERNAADAVRDVLA